MSDIVEKVARAIYQADKPSHHADWEVAAKTEGNRAHWHKVARAAITAMRVPTEKMLEAPGVAGVTMDADWPAMIDEALK